MKPDSRNVLISLRDFHFGQTIRLLGGKFNFICETLRVSCCACVGWYIHKSYLKSEKPEKPENGFKNNKLVS